MVELAILPRIRCNMMQLNILLLCPGSLHRHGMGNSSIRESNPDPKHHHLKLIHVRAAMLLYRLVAPQWEIYDMRQHGSPDWTAYKRPKSNGARAAGRVLKPSHPAKSCNMRRYTYGS